MTNYKLEALLALLDDPNPEIFKRITNELTGLPISAVPQLEDFWLESDNTLFQERLELIINKIQFSHVKKELVDWGKNEHPNLIDGAILINKNNTPNLLVEPIKKIVEKIVQDVRLELNDQLTALEKIKILNHFFYNIYNYQPLPPNQPNNWDGDIGTVLSQKQGNYIILAIIYAGIAQELNIPVYGTNLLESVLLCYVENPGGQVKRGLDNRILFYINPIDKGNIFGTKELDQIIRSKKLAVKPKHYQPCSNPSLIKRLVKHEINVYRKLKLHSFIPNFKELYKVI